VISPCWILLVLALPLNERRFGYWTWLWERAWGVTDWIGQDRRWIGYDNGYGFVSHGEDE
jgi:hypothetical protein